MIGNRKFIRLVHLPLLLAAFTSTSFAQAPVKQPPRGTIHGTIVDEATNRPIAFADLAVLETGYGGITDATGTFLFDVPAGTYDVRAAHISYQFKVLTAISIPPGDTTRVAISLSGNTHQMKRIAVSEEAIESAEAALVMSRAKTVAVQDGISAEQMSKGSSGDAGDALKRVTGISVTDGKYVQVRGLGGRYSNTTLNGSKIPSPEPNRSVVPMDLFPTGLLEKVQVAKTFTPDMAGDFAGGSVQISTKEFPGSRAFSFSTSAGYNSNTSFKNGLVAPSGNLDFLAFDNGTRALPGIITAQGGRLVTSSTSVVSDRGFAPGEVQSFGRSFDNVWSPRETRAGLNQSYSFSLGDQAGLFGHKVGYVYSLHYGYDSKFVEKEINSYRADESPANSFVSSEGSRSASWGQVLNTSMKLDRDNRISLKTMYNRSADNEARIVEGFNADRGNETKSLRLRYVERDLLCTQFTGTHDRFLTNESELVWQGAFARVTRNEPDNREVLYEERNGEWTFFDITQSGSRFFFDLEEVEWSGKLDWKHRLGPRSSDRMLKIGTSFQDKDRTFAGRRFRFEKQTSDIGSVNMNGAPEDIFATENIAPDRFELNETTQDSDNYDATQTITGTYAMVEMPIGEQWKAVGGTRVEYSRQALESFNPFSESGETIETELATTELLPSLSVKYAQSERIHYRAAFSRTVARPDFRELAPFEYTDIVGGRTEIGNPDLDRTRINNFDVRVETIQGADNLFAIGGFYKNFDQPIEQVIENNATPIVSYRNASSANTFGLEIEWRRSLTVVSSRLANFALNTNLTLMQTEVVLSDDSTTVETTRKRALQGQSPFLLNVLLGYHNDERGTSGNLLFNVFGRRIEEVGALGQADVYEEARAQLDFDLRQRLSSNAKIKLACKNILDTRNEYTQSDAVYRRYSTGRSISIGLSYEL